MTYQTYLNFKCYTWSGKKKSHFNHSQVLFFFYWSGVMCEHINNNWKILLYIIKKYAYNKSLPG